MNNVYVILCVERAAFIQTSKMPAASIVVLQRYYFYLIYNVSLPHKIAIFSLPLRVDVWPSCAFRYKSHYEMSRKWLFSALH